MEIPYSLRNSVEELASEYKLAQLVSASSSISEKYRRKERKGTFISNETEALAYALTRMPATYGAVYTAVSKAAECAELNICSLIDAGAGTGAASWAAAEYFDGISEITCLEKEEKMSGLGMKLMRMADFPPSVNWVDFDVTSAEITLKADMTVASYMLNELSDKERERAVLSLWGSAEKLLVIVEPGTPDAFEQMKKIRDILISNGAHIAAPCPHCGACPISGDDWCHFTCRVSRTRLHKQLKGGDAPYEDEKFTYIAAVKSPCTPSAARILRHPKIESGKITLNLCTSDGLETRTVTKKSDMFKKARKSDCGDSF